MNLRSLRFPNRSIRTICSIGSILCVMIFSLGCSRHTPASTNHPTTLAATTQLASTAPFSAAAVAMQQSVNYLASDELEGRGLSTEGINLAAAYIAGNFAGAKLQPLPGMSNYFQPFDLNSIEGIAPETALGINCKPLKLSDQYTVLSYSGEGAFHGPVVFVGYGVTNPAQHYDDYAGIDVKGKVALAWRFEPMDTAGKSRFGKEDWSDSAHLDSKVRAAAEHGAVALILANPPKFKGPDTLVYMAQGYGEGAGAIPMLRVKQPLADDWIHTATGLDPAALEDKIGGALTPQSQSLKDTDIAGKVVLKHTVRHLENVMGYLPGSGPHADEYVVVGAHYDHLGRGGPGSLAMRGHTHDIHHGADDNASGTATVLELASEMGREYQNGHRWPRSIIFMTFTAEEEGLIGSMHWVNHPSVPLDKIVAMVNLDMVGRLRQQQLFIGGEGTAASLESILNKADEGLPLQLKDVGRGGMGPSDHMSFAIKKVPVLFFFTGLHVDYHRPTDTADKINYNGMAEVLDLTKRTVIALTHMPKEAYVTAADAHSMSMGLGGDTGAAGERRASLGVVPSYGEDPSDIAGVKITGVSGGSAAEKAGLQENDIIVGFNEKKLDNLMDLSAALTESKPGDHVKLKVIRNGKPIVLEATLGERK